MKNRYLLILAVIALLTCPNVGFGQAPNLGTTSSFALFTADGALTNSGASVVTGDIGTKLGAYSGFETATVVGQVRLPGSTEANQAAVDVVAAYNSLTAVACGTTILPELGNQTLTQGVYCQNTANPTTLTGTLTLSGPGIFIIKLNSALTTATNSAIALTNGASADNVFFQVNGAATLGTGSTFKGTILAMGAIFLSTQAALEGRALSTVGAITLNNNVVTVPPTLSLSAVAGTCDPATNHYSISGVVSLTNAIAGTATLTDGTVTTTVSVGAGSTSVPYSLSGLTSAASSHTVTVSYNSQVASVTYTAPASCSTATTPTLTVAVTPGACSTVNNAYNLTGTISLSAAVASSLTITDGTSTMAVSVSAGQSSANFSLLALGSGTGNHALTVSGSGYSPASTTYAAPASCTVSATVASLGGTVFADGNDDGIQNGGDTPISGAVVTLLDGTNSPIASTTTGPSGVYSFTGLTPGTPYSLSFTTPTGYTTSASNVGGITGPVTLTSGQNSTSLGTGFVPLVVPANPLLSVHTSVSLSKAAVGNVLTYSLVLTNSGSTSATTTVRDSISTGTTYVAGSAIAPAGTTFTVGQPVSLWNVPFIAAGQSLTLTFQVTVDSTGILYNIATIPGDTVKVCTSIPVKMCVGDEYTLTVPAGRASYRWYRDGVLIAAQTTNVLVITEPGTYSLGVDNAGGLCPDFSCCPFILEADTIPSFQAIAVSSICLGNTVQNNGQIILSNFNTSHRYQYSAGATFDPAASLSGAAKVIPSNGVLVTTLANPGTSQVYTVRVYNSSGCYTDVNVILIPTVCGCPTEICVPYLITQTSRPKRIGDPR